MSGRHHWPFYVCISMDKWLIQCKGLILIDGGSAFHIAVCKCAICTCSSKASVNGGIAFKSRFELNFGLDILDDKTCPLTISCRLIVVIRNKQQQIGWTQISHQPFVAIGSLASLIVSQIPSQQLLCRSPTGRQQRHNWGKHVQPWWSNGMMLLNFFKSINDICKGNFGGGGRGGKCNRWS